MKVRAKDIIEKRAVDPLAGSVRRHIQKRDQYIINQLNMVQQTLGQGDAASAAEKLNFLIQQLQKHTIQGKRIAASDVIARTQRLENLLKVRELITSGRCEEALQWVEQLIQWEQGRAT